MQKIAVYCGSNFGESKAYFDAAQELGRLLAQEHIGLVYGGGKVGLMGTVADAVLAAGGQVTGVIPTFLREMEKAHVGLTELIETPDMTVRKQKMIDLAPTAILPCQAAWARLKSGLRYCLWRNCACNKSP